MVTISRHSSNGNIPELSNESGDNLAFLGLDEGRIIVGIKNAAVVLVQQLSMTNIAGRPRGDSYTLVVKCMLVNEKIITLIVGLQVRGNGAISLPVRNQNT